MHNSMKLRALPRRFRHREDAVVAPRLPTGKAVELRAKPMTGVRGYSALNSGEIRESRRCARSPHEPRRTPAHRTKQRLITRRDHTMVPSNLFHVGGDRRFRQIEIPQQSHVRYGFRQLSPGPGSRTSLGTRECWLFQDSSDFLFVRPTSPVANLTSGGPARNTWA